MRIAPFILFLFLVVSATAQRTNIGPLLPDLSRAQKLQLIEYMRGLENDLDAEIEGNFVRLSQADKSKVLQYALSMQTLNGGKSQRATIQWRQDTLKFGEILEGVVLIDTFWIKNTGDTPYVVTGFQASCDCVLLGPPTRMVMPGEEAPLRVEFNSAGKSGKVRAAVVLQDNSAPNARSILFLTGVVKSPVSDKKRPWE